MTNKDGRVPDGTGLSQAEPCGLGPSGFDPSRWEASRFGKLLALLSEWPVGAGNEFSLEGRAAYVIDRLAEVVEDLCIQYAPKTSYNKSAAIGTAGLSTLEDAFDLLGWHDPHRVPDGTCDEPGCWKWIQAGIPTPDGYRRVCSEHARMVERARDSDGSPKGRDAKRLDGEAATARAEGIAQPWVQSGDKSHDQ